MVISENIYNLINMLIQVILWSLIVSFPLIILTIEMYLYEKYKKWKNAEEQEYEKIIVAKANQITRSDEQLTRQDESKKKLEFEIDMLKIKKKTLHEDLDDDDANENQVEESDDQETQDDQQIDFLKMNIIELKDIAKNRGHKRYSKLSKASLIKLLNN